MAILLEYAVAVSSVRVAATCVPALQNRNASVSKQTTRISQAKGIVWELVHPFRRAMPEPLDPLTAPIEFRRIIREADGQEWLVREIPNAYDRRSGSSLIFERPEVIRKVRTFPSNWRTMSDDELVALSLTT